MTAQDKQDLSSLTDTALEVKAAEFYMQCLPIGSDTLTRVRLGGAPPFCTSCDAALTLADLLKEKKWLMTLMHIEAGDKFLCCFKRYGPGTVSQEVRATSDSPARAITESACLAFQAMQGEKEA